ncbi:MAG TPA: thiol:disulfide interchange protein DsbA/DsbL [Steroidobacteraceae bacterium]|nr:thiol:disulfide interchange protein DsbA/DsbL [Steroidobacteraceae bacterium]
MSAKSWLSSLALCALTLCACNGDQTESPAEPGAAKPTSTMTDGAATATAGAPAPTAPSQAETVPNDGETTPTEQVSEVEESSEKPEAQAGKASLKLSAGAAERKQPPARSSFKEGVHYQRLVPAQPTNAGPESVEVIEVFWYGCPHCFAIDPALEKWRLKDKPVYTIFRRVPAVWNDVTTFHARVFYAAEQLEKLEQLHMPIFREIHVNGDPLNTMSKAKALFTSQGVSAAEFDRTFSLSQVEAKLQAAELLNRRYKVQSVPFFIVNGKYTTNVSAAGGEPQLLQLLSELAAREHGG